MILTNPAYRQTRYQTWEVRFWAIQGTDRVRKFKSGFKLRHHAKVWFREFRKQVESGQVALDPKTARPVSIQAPLLSEFVDQYFRDFPHRRSKSTISLNKQALSHFQEFVQDLPVSQYTPRDIELYLAHRRRMHRSPHTTNRELGYIRKLFSTAERWKLIPSNPCQDIKRDRLPEGKVRYLNPDQQRALIAACDAIQSTRLADHETPYLTTLVILALRTGMRRGELLNLRWKDLDFDRGRISVSVQDKWNPKNRRSRIVPFDHDAQLAVKRWGTWLGSSLNEAMGDSSSKTGSRLLKARNRVSVLRAVQPAPDGPVFPSFKNPGKTLTDSPKALSAAYKHAGLPDLGMHALRHTFAVMCAINNVPIALLKELLGHSDIKTTQIYLRFYPGDALSGFSIPSIGLRT